jgi:hypothetical protein
LQQQQQQFLPPIPNNSITPFLHYQVTTPMTQFSHPAQLGAAGAHPPNTRTDQSVGQFYQSHTDPKCNNTGKRLVDDYKVTLPTCLSGQPRETDSVQQVTSAATQISPQATLGIHHGTGAVTHNTPGISHIPSSGTDQGTAVHHTPGLPPFRSHGTSGLPDQHQITPSTDHEHGASAPLATFVSQYIKHAEAQLQQNEATRHLQFLTPKWPTFAGKPDEDFTTWFELVEKRLSAEKTLPEQYALQHIQLSLAGDARSMYDNAPAYIRNSLVETWKWLNERFTNRYREVTRKMTFNFCNQGAKQTVQDYVTQLKVLCPIDHTERGYEEMMLARLSQGLRDQVLRTKTVKHMFKATQDMSNLSNCVDDLLLYEVVESMNSKMSEQLHQQCKIYAERKQRHQALDLTDSFDETGFAPDDPVPPDIGVSESKEPDDVEYG